MRTVGLRFQHPKTKQWEDVTSVKVIPAGRSLNKAAMKKYAGLDGDDVEVRIGLGPKASTYESVKGPAKVDRLIVGYLRQDPVGNISESYLIVPVGVIRGG